MRRRFLGRGNRRAHVDAATRLADARRLRVELDRCLRRARRSGSPLAVVVVDVDLLRDVNDRHGHLVGDAVVAGVADTIRLATRSRDVAARLDGEGFAVVLPESGQDAAVAVAGRIRTSVEARVFVSGDDSVRATVSLGVACFPDDGHDADGLLHAAGLALYAAKAAGRNRVVTTSGPVLAGA